MREIIKTTPDDFVTEYINNADLVDKSRQTRNVRYCKVPDTRNFLSNKEKRFLLASIAGNDRVTTGLPGGQRIYRGSWYSQGTQPTCVPWAIANACLALNTPVDPGCLQEMVYYARGKGRQGVVSMDLYNAMEIIRGYPSMPLIANISFSLSQEQLVAQVSKTAGNLHIPGAYERINTIYGNYVELVEPGCVNYTGQKDIQRDLFKESAAAISTLIDSGCTVLTAVNVENFLPSREFGSHAVCIAGYRVNKKGHMDVQIMDSARGIYRTSLEYLYSAQWPLYTFAAARPATSGVIHT